MFHKNICQHTLVFWCHDIVAQAQCNDFEFSLIISRHYNLFNGRDTEIQNVNACNVLTRLNVTYACPGLNWPQLSHSLGHQTHDISWALRMHDTSCALNRQAALCQKCHPSRWYYQSHTHSSYIIIGGGLVHVCVECALVCVFRIESRIWGLNNYCVCIYILHSLCLSLSLSTTYLPQQSRAFFRLNSIVLSVRLSVQPSASLQELHS